MFTLETERLGLRPLTLDDAPALHELIDKHEDMWWFDPGYARSYEERVQYVQRRLEQYEHLGFGCFAIETKEDGNLVGQGGLSPYEFEGCDGIKSEVFEVMYAIGLVYQGQGYATEAAAAWVDYAFNVARLPRLVVCPNKANVASVRVLEKLGFHIKDDWQEPGSIVATLECKAE